MKIVNVALLKRFRTAGHCELCGVWCKVREPHHAFTRGAGQLDVPFNLIAVGSTRKSECRCHARVDGRDSPAIPFDEVLAVIAKREGVTPEWIESEVWRLRRLPQPRDGEAEKPLVKKAKKKTAWQIQAGELRRAAAKAAYRRSKGKQ